MSASLWRFQKGPCLPCSQAPSESGGQLLCEAHNQEAETQEEVSHFVQSKAPPTGQGAWGSDPMSAVTSSL